MYVKPPSKQIRGIYVPDNYHGTAFDDSRNTADTEQTPPDAPMQNTNESTQDVRMADQAVSASKKQDCAGLSSLFSGLGSLHSDDILLLALIFLLARGSEQDRGVSEILPLLAILLFIGS